MGTMYPNVCRFQKHINMSTLKAIFGMDFSDNCGKAAYPAIQAAPCLSSTFPHIFGNKNIPCLIPCGIDQDPYFRMTRDVCSKLKAPKPAGFYSKFFPSLQGF
jgi:tryptophanyl-tRNA synthetase